MKSRTKVHTLFPEDIPTKLWPLPVRELFSVGGATADKLERAGIRTIGDLAGISLPYAQTLLVKIGNSFIDYAMGWILPQFWLNRRKPRGIAVSTTLAQDVTDTDTAHKILLELADSVTARMRADHIKAYCIGVSIRSRDFKNRSHQRRLPDATDITKEVYEVSKALLAEVWKGRFPFRLIGISLTQLVHEDAMQLSLFRDEGKERARKLDKALDDIRGRYGLDTIKRGSTLHSLKMLERSIGRSLRKRMMRKSDNFRHEKRETEAIEAAVSRFSHYFSCSCHSFNTASTCAISCSLSGM